MSKVNIETLIEQTEELLKGLKALGGSADEGSDAVSIPTPDDLGELDKAGIVKLAAQLGIGTEEVPTKSLKAMLATASAIVHDEGVEDLDEDAVTTLAEAVGLSTTGKQAKILAALKKYLEAEKDSEDADADDEKESDSDDADDEDEKPAKKKKKVADEDEDEKESDDSDESEEDDEDEKPAKKKKKAADDDDDDEKESDESDDDDEEEVSPKEQKARLAAYNKHAKKPAKTYDELLKRIVDGDGDPVKWGVPYVKGDTAYCCGLPLKDVKVGEDEDEEAGKCLVTGKLFVQNEDGELVEREED